MEWLRGLSPSHGDTAGGGIEAESCRGCCCSSCRPPQPHYGTEGQPGCCAAGGPSREPIRLLGLGRGQLESLNWGPASSSSVSPTTLPPPPLLPPSWTPDPAGGGCAEPNPPALPGYGVAVGMAGPKCHPQILSDRPTSGRQPAEWPARPQPLDQAHRVRGEPQGCSGCEALGRVWCLATAVCRCHSLYLPRVRVLCAVMARGC